MKKLIIGVLALSLFSNAATAHSGGGGCCTLSGSYLGILPQVQKNFVGIRYNTRSYTMPAMYMDHGQGPMMHAAEATDRFSSLDMWARLYPAPRIQVLATLPYVINTSRSGQKNTQAAGVGDASITASYVIAATPDSAICQVKHRLQAGGGIKLPTGKSPSKSIETISAPANFTPGTGTVDFLATVTYTVRAEQLGFNTDFVYKFNNENKNGYRFGNQYSGSAQTFYWYKLNQLSLLPAAGIYYEKALANQLNSKELAKQDGATTFSTCGLGIYYKNISVGGTWQRPFTRQHQQGGMIKNDRFMTQVTLMF